MHEAVILSVLHMKIETTGGLSWIRQWNFGLCTKGGLRLTERLLASQDGLCSIKLVMVSTAHVLLNFVFICDPQQIYRISYTF